MDLRVARTDVRTLHRGQHAAHGARPGSAIGMHLRISDQPTDGARAGLPVRAAATPAAPPPTAARDGAMAAGGG